MKAAISQLNSKLDYRENLKDIHRVAAECRKQECQLLFLPECFYSMSDGTKPTPHLVEQNNEHYKEIKKIAQEHELFLLGGTAATLHKGVVVNRAYNFGPDGADLGHYDKMHLFSCSLSKKDQETKIDEADIYTPGNEPKMIEALGLLIGLGVCFDIRYPEMARNYVLEGANLLTFSSAFTIPTGKAHWHTLVRARAIENQCFVVAAAQVGKHNEKIQTYGHSLVVGPWGEILVDAGEEVGLHFFDIDLSLVDQIRKSVGVFSHYQERT
jgi:predicted amidohydrolase